jgi:hypothetical protein
VKPIHWEAPARAEFEWALATSPYPSEFQQTITDALEAIASGRMTHARVPRTLARRCDLVRPPYAIIYIETDAEIRVWAFAHHKRRPGYWKDRLP